MEMNQKYIGLKFSPDGTKLAFKCRHADKNNLENWLTSSFVYDLQTERLHLLEHETSHVIWFNNTELILSVWEDVRTMKNMFIRRYTFDGSEYETLFEFWRPPHILPLSDNQLLYDTPYSAEASLNIFDIQNKKSRQLFKIDNKPLNGDFGGEYRCDLHAGLSVDKRKIIFDSDADGGRQIYAYDL